MGKRHSPNTEFKKGHKLFVGEKHPNWKGGISKFYKNTYNCESYRKWREAVFERDNYTCQECGNRGVQLQAHHIKSYSYYPKLRYKLSNGKTLCLECHKKTDSFSWRSRKVVVKDVS